MARLTPEQEASYALTWDLSRGDLSMAAQLEYDRLKPDWDRKVAASREAARRPAVRQDVPSARWSRFAGVTLVLGVFTGFYGTIPAGIALFHLDNVATAAHFSDIQDVIAWTAFGVLVTGPAVTVYFTVRFAKRRSVLASTFGVTVFNWKTVTVPWDNIADVVLTPATRVTRRGWVPGIAQKDGQVLPVAFAAFLPSGGQPHGPPPKMPETGEVSEVAALIRRGLDAHNQQTAQSVGTVPDRALNGPEAGRNPLELPPVDGQPWTSDRLAISGEWVAFKDVLSGQVPWNVIPYAAVSSVRPAADGSIVISRADNLCVVIGQRVLASPEASSLLAEGLSTNPTVAPAAAELLQPRLAAAERKRDASLGRRHAVNRSGTTHTFRFHRGLHLIVGILALAMGAASLALAIAAPLTAWSPNVGGKGDEIWAIGLGLVCVWFGTRQFRVGVQVRSQKLTIRNDLRSRTVEASDISAITLRSKSMGQAGEHWIPRVDLTDGNSFWITSFDCGPVARPPKTELAATVDEVRVLLGVKADDIRKSESRQPGGDGS